DALVTISIYALLAQILTRTNRLEFYLAACADICDACAKECESMADGADFMQRCADACRKCAESCRQMSSGSSTSMAM
ncbi:MAG: four-helix bundle copper-binding protein, partial [Acidobacteriota bacterium]|nr:four-helix bundle copper-binding protein [Acidobacteriota bacterium]